MALWTMIFPADVVKSRMQIRCSVIQIMYVTLNNFHCSGKGRLFDSLLTIAREEGKYHLFYIQKK